MFFFLSVTVLLTQSEEYVLQKFLQLVSSFGLGENALSLARKLATVSCLDIGGLIPNCRHIRAAYIYDDSAHIFFGVAKLHRHVFDSCFTMG